LFGAKEKRRCNDAPVETNTSLRAIAKQSRRMQGVHALATGLPRRCAPRNDIFYNFTSTHHVIAKRGHGVARWRAVAISSHAGVHALVTGGARRSPSQ
jgi:hypothetical protein